MLVGWIIFTRVLCKGVLGVNYNRVQYDKEWWEIILHHHDWTNFFLFKENFVVTSHGKQHRYKGNNNNSMMLITLLINWDGFVWSGFVRWLRLGGWGNEVWIGMEFSIPYHPSFLWFYENFKNLFCELYQSDMDKRYFIVTQRVWSSSQYSENCWFPKF